MITLNDIFINNLPTLDLHGMTREEARIMTMDFVHDNHYLKNKTIVIIHGFGTGIVKEAVHDELKHNRLVLSYHINPFNNGVTVINIKF